MTQAVLEELTCKNAELEQIQKNQIKKGGIRFQVRSDWLIQLCAVLTGFNAHAAKDEADKIAADFLDLVLRVDLSLDEITAIRITRSHWKTLTNEQRFRL
ncbi:hypothetical protein SKAU_G00176750 [Synaphobranchus kaupii]|uniref:Uncharacterized protein n=1 Tax=Synaphobranchus kaupii TaxID=118154 RepID=A0A9Q1FLI6_SYNKA|nr:hypothetical protein SKAU_G00176750 [Synaphobranchus kaupii]